jgi:hypothetical protein
MLMILILLGEVIITIKKSIETLLDVNNVGETHNIEVFN